MKVLRALTGRTSEPAPATARVRRAVIDIGSSSLRLVVWSGPARLPTVILNEKVVANLGSTLATDGRLPRKAMATALQALARFALLVRALEVTQLRLVATAAVRDATNGAAFLDQVRALGLAPELLSGEQEAEASAFGVASAFPGATGIVGDLGGGSLELVALDRGVPGRGDSFTWGTLRLAELRAQRGGLARPVAEQLAAADWTGAAGRQPLYLVGGSWRALTLFAMHEAGLPLDDPHGHALTPDEADTLANLLADVTPRRLRAVPGLPASRIATLPDAAALLAEVVRQLKPAQLVTSAFGLREGLLYASLDPATREADPLFVAIRERACGHRTGGQDGTALARWIAPLFTDESAADARLRTAACLLVGLVDRGGARAPKIIDLMLANRWIGADTAGRAMIAAALLAEGGARAPRPLLDRLAPAADLARATRWGQAMRLARKLSGGAEQVLTRSGVRIADDALVLTLATGLGPLYVDGAAQSHATLAAAFGLRPVVDEPA